MDYITTFLLLLSLIWVFAHALNFFSPFIRRRSSGKARLPPGPTTLPIVGSLFKLGHQPHKSLADLSRKYGPVMFLKLGGIPTVVISSSQTAQQVLQKHDHLLSDRVVPDAVRALDHHRNSMVWLPASDKWRRRIKKIAVAHLLSPQRLDATQALRGRKVEELVEHARQSCRRGEAVNIGWAAFATSLNLLSNTVFSTDLVDYDSKLSQGFKDVVWGVMEEIGRLNVADYFPVFRWIDPQGVRRAMEVHLTKFSDTFLGIIEERRLKRSSAASNDVLDDLLSLTEEDSEWSVTDIIHLLLDIFSAGTDTTSSTVEWAMAELIRNPETMAKAQRELQEVIGKDGMVRESDISKLPYLQCVVKETLRLHPAAPLLLPHKARADVESIGGGEFTIPMDYQVLVNAWAIGRDPTTWSRPNDFVAERFLVDEDDDGSPTTTTRVGGGDRDNFESIPFGAGRRMCPGMILAQRMVHLMLASLLHSFHWRLEDDDDDALKPEDMDMTEKFGITLQKAKPLRAIPVTI